MTSGSTASREAAAGYARLHLVGYGAGQAIQSGLVVCEDASNELFLSVVSAWEIQIKTQINRLRLDLPLSQMIEGQQA